MNFHGPEQIVGYPILDLEKFSTDLGYCLRSLEEVTRDILALEEQARDRVEDDRGVEADRRGARGDHPARKLRVDHAGSMAA